MSEQVKTPKTTEELISGLRRQIRSVEARAMAEDIDTDPGLVLAELLSMAREMEEAAGRVARDMHTTRGTSWGDIGFNVGISKQGAFNRWGR